MLNAPPGRTAGWRPPTARELMGPWWRTLREGRTGPDHAGRDRLLFVAYQLWGTGIAEAHSQAALKRSFNAAVATQQPADDPTVAPAAGTKPSTAAPSRRHAEWRPRPSGHPAIGVNVYVVQGVADEDLRDAAPATIHRRPYRARWAMPPSQAIAPPMGRRSTPSTSSGGRLHLPHRHGGPHLCLPGDEPPRVVSPSDVSVLEPTPFPQLTLTT